MDYLIHTVLIEQLIAINNSLISFYYTDELWNICLAVTGLGTVEGIVSALPVTRESETVIHMSLLRSPGREWSHWVTLSQRRQICSTYSTKQSKSDKKGKLITARLHPTVMKLLFSEWGGNVL